MYAPALVQGATVIDAGANRGLFSTEITGRFSVSALAIEANPDLARALRRAESSVAMCALGSENREASFQIGHNDESSSLRVPRGGTQLIVRETISVEMKTLPTVLEAWGLVRVACVKLDIEGAEIDVIQALGPAVRHIAPQWTVEFHDDVQFQLCDPQEVDAAVATMTAAGFSCLVRNWPSRTNTLFLDRQALSISRLRWWGIKVRYQYLAVVWRKLAGLA